MPQTTILFRIALLWVCASFAATGLAGGVEYKNNPVERWDVFELTIDGPDDDDAYVSVHLAATFRNGSDHITVPGFYDGDGTYKVRFSPPALGRWKFTTRSSRRELSGKSGSFTCVPPTSGNHGPVRVVNTFYLQYADGAPFYGVGTTAYQWTSVDQAVQQMTLDTLSSAPFNKIRMCFFPKSYRYGNDTEPWTYPFKRHNGENDFTHPNYEFFRNFDERIRQLLKMGIQADVILFHSYDKWGYAKMGSENDDRYLRYLIARLSAFRNVWWSMANEWDLMLHNQEKTEADFARFLQICRDEDPHQRLRGIHNWHSTDEHFYDHSQPAVTHISTQTSQFFNALKWRGQYGKPLLYDEMRYEGDVASNWGNMSSLEMTSYFWMAGLSGGYGTHGDTYDNRAGGSETRWWGKGGTLIGQSPARIAFFRKILEEAPVTEMIPTRVSTGSPESRSENIYIFAKPGEHYLAYSAHAGATIQLNLPAGATYKVELIDTWNMTIDALPDAGPGEFTLTTSIEYAALRITAD